MLKFDGTPAIPDLAGHVRLRLDRWLSTSEWRQGGRLPTEEELAKRFEVSRPTLRKALEELRKTGRIISRRGSGNFVQPMAGLADSASSSRDLTIRTVFDMKKCLGFRTSIECAAAEEAALQRDQAAIGAMRRSNERLAKTGAGISVFEADFEFHLALAHATLNPYFAFVLETIRDQIRLTVEFTRNLQDRPLDEVEPRVLQEHEMIVKAVEGGNGDQARQAMQNHMRHTLTRLLGDQGERSCSGRSS